MKTSGSRNTVACVVAGGIHLSLGLFLVLMGLGAASIALWLDVRFPRLEPVALWPVFVHVVLSIVAAHLLVPSAFAVLDDNAVQALLATFTVAFPILVYSLLVAFWLMKLARRALTGFGH